MKLGDMTDRELILFVIGDVRSVQKDITCVKKAVTNHLSHHEKQDERRWKMYLILFGVFVTTVAGLFVTLIT